MNIKLPTYILFFFICINLLAQEKKTKFFTEENFAELLHKKTKNKNLFKVIQLLEEDKFDSCYIISNEEIKKSKDSLLTDYFTYFKGATLSFKGLPKKSNLILDKVRTKKMRSQILIRKAYNYNIIDQYDQTVKLLRRCYDVVSKQDSVATDIKAEIFDGLSVGYSFFPKKMDSAFYFLKKLKTTIIPTDTLGLISYNNTVASFYSLEKNEEKSLQYYLKSYEYAQASKDNKAQSIIAENIALTYYDLKNYKKSSEYHLDASLLKDTIYNKDKIWVLAEKEKELALTKKNKEITIQKEKVKNEKQTKKLLLSSGGILLISVIVLIYFLSQLFKKNKFIKQQRNHLKAANKTKDYLFSVVSHDLRSPINTIERQHKKILKNLKSGEYEKAHQLTKDTITITNSTKKLLNNVLHWALEQGNQLNFNLERTAINPVIEHVLFDYNDLISSKEIKLKTNIASNLYTLIDKESVKIVLRNLLDNATKYTKKGTITINCALYDDTIKIEINDTGKGITTKKLKEINALSNLSSEKINRSEGIGLGMILCFSLIKKNNGTLMLESEEAKGTKATIFLKAIN